MICLSRVLSARGNPEAAAEAAERALQVDPRYDRAWRQLAGIRLTQKRWEEAMEFVTKALEADPEWVQGNRLLGLALEGLGDFERAAVASEKALRGNPESSEALRQYIHQMLRLEKRSEARSLLSTLVQEGADTPLLHNALGELYYYDEDYAQARPHFSKAAQGGVTSAYNNLGVTYFMERDFENACRAFEQCLAADPRHKGARKNLMRAMGHLNRS